PKEFCTSSPRQGPGEACVIRSSTDVHAFASQASRFRQAAATISLCKRNRAADRCAFCGLHAAHFHSDLDAPAAAAGGLRQSSCAHARDRNLVEERAACAVL